MTVPSPREPAPLSPQHTTEPDERRAHVCELPDVSSTASVKSMTSTGSARRSAQPSPSPPPALSPQRTPELDGRRAHTYALPTVSSTASNTPSVAIGVHRSEWVSPPQHHTEPDERRAHV